MADEIKNDTVIESTIDKATAPLKVAATVVEQTAKKAAQAPAKAVRARRARKASAKVVEAVTKNNKRAAKTARRVTKATVEAAAAPIERTKTMAYDFNSLFAGFQFPAADKFQNVLGDAGDRGQQLVGKTQKVAEEMTDIAKANVEAIVEAGRIAATGARSIGQDVLSSSRDGIEQASDAFKTLAEAKSPTEFFQIQSELVRASFDRMVAQSSQLTERVVKLAGEAAQPLQNRASVNAERMNDLVA
ncbi:phasin family protein [Sphingomonas sp. LY160]|uniref:phasin family protein n=1 Tax=Sphingomonas sp. LY160 TaxID=3095342 RepID=UPI002ADEFABD|nr:phasin family protein [Sphingomonas sp. LY160]MEA1072800.1 phasin family protein [Sphingomonas sp. LY160]